MTVSGIPVSPPSISTTRPEHREIPGERGHVPATTRAPDTVRVTQSVRRTSTGSGAIPVSAPAGTDPDLWSVLTAAERDFFARGATAGPLTYAKVTTPLRGATRSAPTSVGGRIDVRV